MKKGFTTLVVVTFIALSIGVLGTTVYFKINQKPHSTLPGQPKSSENFIAENTSDLKSTIRLKDQATNDQANELLEEINKIEGVVEVKLFSKKESFKIYKERNKNYPLLTESVTEDFFAITIDVSFNNPSSLEQFVSLTNKKTYVDMVFTPPIPSSEE